jgi:hypothetical protein
MPGCRAFSLILVAALGALPAAAQPTATVEGRVEDARTGMPLPGAHVFISASMIGTATDTTGRFRLEGVPVGAKRLVVSMLGYEPKRLSLFLQADTTVSRTFSLVPTVLEAEEVVVEDERDDEWYDDLRTFKRLFIGTTPLARDCELLNPTVLRFDSSWWKGLEATATAPLRFRNEALGYRLRYTLKEFDQSGTVVKWDGDPHFEELTPADSAEAARWRTARRDAYRGSLRHFLRALLSDRVEAEGFRMQRLPRPHAFRHTSRADRFPVSRDDLIVGQTDSTYLFRFRGRLEVTYRREPESRGYLRWSRQHRRTRDVQTSWIELNDPPVNIDRVGEIVEPYGATVFGYFAYEQRISGLLPRGYRPSTARPATTAENR